MRLFKRLKAGISLDELFTELKQVFRDRTTIFINYVEEIQKFFQTEVVRAEESFRMEVTALRLVEIENLKTELRTLNNKFQIQKYTIDNLVSQNTALLKHLKLRVYHHFQEASPAKNWIELEKISEEKSQKDGKKPGP